MNKNNEVVVFGLDVFSDINLPIIPTLSSSDALISAKQNLPFSITESNIEDKSKNSTNSRKWKIYLSFSICSKFKYKK